MFRLTSSVLLVVASTYEVTNDHVGSSLAGGGRSAQQLVDNHAAVPE